MSCIKDNKKIHNQNSYIYKALLKMFIDSYDSVNSEHIKSKIMHHRFNRVYNCHTPRIEKQLKKVNKQYYIYESVKAKKILREFNYKYRNGKSEVQDKWGIGTATQIHHIFPQHEFLEISMYLENLIAITPTQHFTKAHPNNNTKLISKEYQKILLHAKAMQIKDNISDKLEPTIYDFNKFIHVLNVGFDKDYQEENGDYTTVMQIIDSNY